MKYTLNLFLTLIAFATMSFAQSHSATLTWSHGAGNVNPTSNVYRLANVCPTSGTSGFTQVATGISGTSYVDTTITPGAYCYYVTDVVNGQESVPSNLASAALQPASPSLTVVVK